MPPTRSQIDGLRDRLERNPSYAELVNAVWWDAVAERVAELPDDLQTQAEDHLEALLMLLRGDDPCAA